VRAGRAVPALVLALGLVVASGLAQEAGVAVKAGGFFASEAAYREIYGPGVPVAVEIWLKAKGPWGVAAGFSWIEDDGRAVAMEGGEAEYPLAFRRTTIPVVAFYELDLRSVRIRIGAGLGIHRYEEVWLTSDLEFRGDTVSPRFMVSASTRLVGRLSLVGTLVYEKIPTGAGSVLAGDVDLGGFQALGGLSYCLFRKSR
jgi:hypothetical protein